jgi:hypothetical protein
VIDRRAQLAFVFPEPAVARTRVRVASGLRFDLAGLLIEEFGHAPAAVLIDSELERLWAKDIEKGLSSAVVRVSLPRGEACKNADEWALRAQELVRLGIKRSDYIVAIGGGATCDLAGAVAASVLRGIPVVHVPTTLLAMVDAGLGGKCGVNLPEGKKPPRLLSSSAPAARRPRVSEHAARAGAPGRAGRSLQVCNRLRPQPVQDTRAGHEQRCSCPTSRLLERGS